MDELGISPIDALTYQKLGKTIMEGKGDKAISIIDKELEKDDIEDVPKALLSFLRWLLKTEPFSKILLNLPEVELEDVVPYVRLGKAVKDGKGERAISIINKQLENEDLMTIFKMFFKILRWLLETAPFSKILLNLPGSDISLKDVMPYVHLAEAIKDGRVKKATMIIEKQFKKDDIKTIPKLLLKSFRCLLETEPLPLLLEGPKTIRDNSPIDLIKNTGHFVTDHIKIFIMWIPYIVSHDMKFPFAEFDIPTHSGEDIKKIKNINLIPDKSRSDSNSNRGHGLKLHAKFGKHNSGSDNSESNDDDVPNDGKNHKSSKWKEYIDEEKFSKPDKENKEKKGLCVLQKKLADDQEVDEKLSKLEESKLKKSEGIEISSGTEEEKKELFGRHEKLKANKIHKECNITKLKNKKSPQIDQENKEKKSKYDTSVKLPDDRKDDIEIKLSKLKKSKQTEEYSETNGGNEDKEELFGGHGKQTDNEEGVNDYDISKLKYNITKVMSQNDKDKTGIHDTFVKLPDGAKDVTKPKLSKFKESKVTGESCEIETKKGKKKGSFARHEKVPDDAKDDTTPKLSKLKKSQEIEESSETDGENDENKGLFGRHERVKNNKGEDNESKTLKLNNKKTPEIHQKNKEKKGIYDTSIKLPDKARDDTRPKLSKATEPEETEESSETDGENDGKERLFGRHKKQKENEEGDNDSNILKLRDKKSSETNQKNKEEKGMNDITPKPSKLKESKVTGESCEIETEKGKKKGSFARHEKVPDDAKDDTTPKLSKLKKSQETEESSETDGENDENKGLFGRHERVKNNKGEDNESKTLKLNNEKTPKIHQKNKEKKGIYDTSIKLPDKARDDTKPKLSKAKEPEETKEYSETDEENDGEERLFGRHKSQKENEEGDYDSNISKLRDKKSSETNQKNKEEKGMNDVKPKPSKLEESEVTGESYKTEAVKGKKEGLLGRHEKLPDDAKDDTEPKLLRLKKSQNSKLKTKESFKTDEKKGLFGQHEKVKDNKGGDNVCKTHQGNKEQNGSGELTDEARYDTKSKLSKARESNETEESSGTDGDNNEKRSLLEPHEKVKSNEKKNNACTTSKLKNKISLETNQECKQKKEIHDTFVKLADDANDDTKKLTESNGTEESSESDRENDEKLGLFERHKKQKDNEEGDNHGNISKLEDEKSTEETSENDDDTKPQLSKLEESEDTEGFSETDAEDDEKKRLSGHHKKQKDNEEGDNYCNKSKDKKPTENSQNNKEEKRIIETSVELPDDAKDDTTTKLSELNESEETEESSDTDGENDEKKGLFGHPKKQKDNEGRDNNCKISKLKDKKSTGNNLKNKEEKGVIENFLKLPDVAKDDTKPKPSKLKKSEETEESSETDGEDDEGKGLFGRHKKQKGTEEEDNDSNISKLRDKKSTEADQKNKEKKGINDISVKLPEGAKDDTTPKSSKLKESVDTEKSSGTHGENDEEKRLFERHKKQQENEEEDNDSNIFKLRDKKYTETNQKNKEEEGMNDISIKLPDGAKDDITPKSSKLKESQETEESSETDGDNDEEKRLFGWHKKQEETKGRDNNSNISKLRDKKSTETNQKDEEKKDINDISVKLLVGAKDDPTKPKPSKLEESEETEESSENDGENDEEKRLSGRHKKQKENEKEDNDSNIIKLRDKKFPETDQKNKEKKGINDISVKLPEGAKDDTTPKPSKLQESVETEESSGTHGENDEEKRLFEPHKKQQENEEEDNHSNIFKLRHKKSTETNQKNREEKGMNDISIKLPDGTKDDITPKPSKLEESEETEESSGTDGENDEEKRLFGGHKKQKENEEEDNDSNIIKLRDKKSTETNQKNGEPKGINAISVKLPNGAKDDTTPKPSELKESEETEDSSENNGENDEEKGLIERHKKQQKNEEGYNDSNISKSRDKKSTETNQKNKEEKDMNDISIKLPDGAKDDITPKSSKLKKSEGTEESTEADGENDEENGLFGLHKEQKENSSKLKQSRETEESSETDGENDEGKGLFERHKKQQQNEEGNNDSNISKLRDETNQKNEEEEGMNDIPIKLPDGAKDDITPKSSKLKKSEETEESSEADGENDEEKGLFGLHKKQKENPSKLKESKETEESSENDGESDEKKGLSRRHKKQKENEEGDSDCNKSKLKDEKSIKTNQKNREEKGINNTSVKLHDCAKDDTTPKPSKLKESKETEESSENYGRNDEKKGLFGRHKKQKESEEGNSDRNKSKLKDKKSTETTQKNKEEKKINDTSVKLPVGAKGDTISKLSKLKETEEIEKSSGTDGENDEKKELFGEHKKQTSNEEEDKDCSKSKLKNMKSTETNTKEGSKKTYTKRSKFPDKDEICDDEESDDVPEKPKEKSDTKIRKKRSIKFF